MRSSSKSRSRNKNNNRNRSVGNVVNRVFDSAGPEGKVRGTPQQIIEKYQTLARDAQLSNDRVAAENFLQHSEHYTRMLNEAMREQAERQEAERQANEAQARQREAQREAQSQQHRENGNEHQPRQEHQARAEAQSQPQDQPSTPEPRKESAPASNGASMMPPLNGHDEIDEGPALVETPEGAKAEAAAPAPAKKPRTRRSSSRAKKETDEAKPVIEVDTGTVGD